MKNTDFKEFQQRMFDICKKISEDKSFDYASQDDALKNFRQYETFGIRTVDGILSRMIDKMSRISNLVNRPEKIHDEKIEDTIVDLINYSVLLAAFLGEEK